ncbi:MAG: urea transporter [Weeksellaceae bacterium]|jgi:urea transporter|nr:urea transporter [Weeksellaceae bacterium]
MKIINWTLKGIGQIMLQENALTGLIFLSTLTISNWKYGLAVILATLSGTIIAQILKFPEKEIKAGLYGFSAALVGVVLVFLFEFTIWIGLLVVLGAVLATLLQRFFIKIKFPAYTFPFILVAWVFIYFLTISSSVLPSENHPEGNLKWIDFLLLAPKSYAQVIFQSDFWIGILFFLGVCIHSLAAGLYGLFAAFLTSLLAFYLGQNPEDITAGLFGYNAVLTAIVFAGSRLKDGVWVVISIILTLLVQLILVETEILKAVGGVLTFP